MALRRSCAHFVDRKDFTPTRQDAFRRFAKLPGIL